MTITYTGNIGYDAFGAPWAIGENSAGTLTIDAGSDFIHGSSTVAGGSFLQLGVNAGSSGTVNVSGVGSTFTVLGSGHDDAGFQIGRAGTGLFQINAGGALIMTDLTTTPNSYIGFTIGREATGNGTMNVDAGSISVSGWGSYCNVGRDGAGAFTLSNGGSYSVSVTQDAALQIGRATGSHGTMTVNAGSSVVLHSGTATPINPAFYTGTTINVGRDGGVGILNIAGSVSLESSVGTSSMAIGRGTLGGSGTLTMTAGSDLSISTSERFAYLAVGVAGGVGSATITGATVDISTTATDWSAGLLVGLDSGHGSLVVDSSTVTISAAAGWAQINAGLADTVSGGAGDITFRNGSIVNLVGHNGATVFVGNGQGLAGTLNVSSGSAIHLSASDANAYDEAMIIGEQPGGAHASVTIDGAGSLIDGLDITVVGYNPFNAGNGVGNGSLTIDHGGALVSDEVTVGRGGVMAIGAGTVTTAPAGWMSVYEGTLRLLSSGIANITGNFWMQPNSTIVFEVAADGSNAGQINHTGGVFGWDSGQTLIVDPLGGYRFAAGETHLLFGSTSSIQGGAADLIVLGQDADFGYAALGNAAGTEIRFQAINDGNGTTAAIFDLGPSNAGTTLNYDSALGYGHFNDGVSGGALYNIDGIDGTDSADLFDFSGSGAESLNGRGGADYLDAGGGFDRMDGGAGADEIVYDPNDDLAFVLGGADFDTLLVNEMPAPTSFDLVAHGFEAARTLAEDLANTQVWSSVTRVYDSAWRIQTETLVFDDNSNLVSGYDLAGLLDWTEDRDAAGVLTRYTNFDQDGSEGGWASFYDQYVGGVRTQRLTTYDNGASQREGFDALARLDWLEEYDDASALARYTDYDQANDPANAWTSFYNLYVGGVRDQQFTLYDSGASQREGYDATGFTLWRQEFDETGVLVRYTEYNPAAANPLDQDYYYNLYVSGVRTQQYQEFVDGSNNRTGYLANGDVDWIQEYRADGTLARNVDYGSAPGEAWNYLIDYYDAMGDWSSRYILFDDGTEQYI